jgi:hypothetical protein
MELDSQLSRGVVFYLGYGERSAPLPDPQRVVAEFGPQRGEELVTTIQALVAEVMAAPVDWASETLSSATDDAHDRMHRAHPELADDAVQALAWIFSWDWR